jgi:hypothetical protein
MHAAIDGDLRNEERAELDRQLAQDPAARALFSEFCSVDAALHTLPWIDPPAELRQSLRVAAKQHQAPHNEARPESALLFGFLLQIIKRQFIKGTALMSTQGQHTFGRQKVWAVVGVLAIAVGVIGYLDLGSENSYLSGALQQADRYRDNNISSDDVVLGNDDVAQLLQSDAFIALIEDDSFIQLMADAKFVDLMANRQFHALMANRQVQHLMADRQFQGLMQDAKFSELMANRQLQQLMSDAKLDQLMADRAWSELMTDARNVELMSNAAFQQLLANRNFQGLMANSSFSNLLSQARVINLMADARMASLMADGRMVELMSDVRVRALQDARVNEARATQ